MTNIHWWYQYLSMKMTIDMKRDENKNIQSVYVRMNGMWLVFANEKHFIWFMRKHKYKLEYIWYTRVSKKFSKKIKVDEELCEYLGIWVVCEKQLFIIIYQPFFAVTRLSSSVIHFHSRTKMTGLYSFYIPYLKLLDVHLYQ